MAKKALNYPALLKQLKEDGPKRLYLLWGEESYLKEQFLAEIRKLCVERETEEFNHRRLSGEGFTPEMLADELNAMPFMSERILIEVRDFEINRYRESDAEKLKAELSDIPDYITVALTLSPGYEPDGRLAAFKLIKKLGDAVEFTAQGQAALLNWISRRCSAGGKHIGRAEAEHLIFNCGSLMDELIPEIDKVCAYAKGGEVTIADIDAVTTPTSAARVFDMTDRIARGDFDGSAGLLSILLAGREEPIMLLAMIGQQFRGLYAARLALKHGGGAALVMECCNLKYDFQAKKLLEGARHFKLDYLKNALELCVEADYAMKSGGGDSVSLLKELLLKLAVSHA